MPPSFGARGSVVFDDIGVDPKSGASRSPASSVSSWNRRDHVAPSPFATTCR